MPNTSKTHDENRSKVCLLCFQRDKNIRSAESPENLRRIHEYFFENYDPSDLKLPIGICSCCNRKLLNLENKKLGKDKDKPLPEVILPDPVDFSKLKFPASITRSRGGDLQNCDCDICEIAREEIFKNPKLKGTKGFKTTLGRPRKDIPRLPTPRPIKKCQRCDQVVGRGIPHPQPCTITDLRRNTHLNSLKDPLGRAYQAGQVVKELAEAAGSSKFIPVPSRNGGSLNLSFDKPSTSRALFPDNKPISVKEFDKLAEKLHISHNQEEDLAQCFRGWKGANVFEANLSTRLLEKRRTGAEFFTVEKFEMDVAVDRANPGQFKREFRPVFYCKNVIELFKFVAHRRGYHPQTDLIELFGCDKGGKILPSVKKVVNIKKVVDEFSSPSCKGKRSSYQQGAFPKAFKDSGVNRTIVLALAPYCCESYSNLEVISKILKLDYTLLKSPSDTNDLLCSPKFCGVGTAASTYPCHVCEMAARDFGKVENDLFLKGGKLRTLKSIDDNAMQYQEDCKTHKKKTKLSSASRFNCEKRPLYYLHNIPFSKLVLLLMPPPELHILLGLGNDFFDLIVDRLKAKDPTYLEIIKNFLKRHSLLRQVYFLSDRKDFPGQFDGDSCKFFLNLVDKLEAALKEVAGAFEAVEDILVAMKAFNNVRKQCFTVDLDPNYKNGIREFAHLWVKCNRAITLKCHILFVHVVQFLESQKDRYPNKGLGFWAEQASEGSHNKADKAFAAYLR